MSAASYTTDLVDVSLAESATNWAESTDANWDDGGTATLDADYPFIQGSGSISQAMTKATICSLLFNNGSGITLPTDGAFLVWQIWTGPGSTFDTLANGGLRVMVGSALNAFNSWDVGGNDFGRNPYGGWQNHAVNTTLTADDVVGSPSGTLQFVGAAVKVLTGIGKGNPHAVDAIRYGRCEARINGGTSPDPPATFAGFAAQNDSSSNRWGLIQVVPGGYLWKGLLTLGYTSVVDFRDSNTQILVDDTRKVTANFNKIEIRQASSRVDWTGITFKALGTVSKGRLEVIDDADVNIAGCTFDGMDTFIFKAASAVLTSTFRNCRQITANGATFNGSLFTGFEGTSDTGYLLWNTSAAPNGRLDGCEFVKGTASTHAIEFGTSAPTTMTLTDVTFSGYNASDGQTDSALLFPDTGSNVTWTVTISGGTTPSYKKLRSGDTVTIVSGAVNVSVNVKNVAGSNIENARVLLKAASGGPFPFDVTVTITNSGTTATVAHTSHGLATNDKVLIKGASHIQNNGVFSITVTNANEYTYTMGSAPGSNPTGTIKSTFVALSGLTDANGNITTSRVYASDQPVSGWARKSSAQPFYKEALLGGSVDNVAGYSANVQLVGDE